MSGRDRLHVFVLIDALGWKIVEGRDFLPDLLPYRKPLRTVLGYSSGAIPTILTGEPPARHGHWNLFYYDPVGSPFRWLRHFNFLPDAVLENRVARKVLKEIGRRALGLGPLFECSVHPRLLPYFNWTEKNNIYDPGGIQNARSIFDELADGRVRARVYSYHRFSDEEILSHACRDLETRDDSFFFLYLSGVDSLLHLHCDDPALLDERLGWYGRELRAVFDRATRRDDQATLTVFSDHGMTPVRGRCELVRRVKALGFREPQDYLAVYDSTMARFWFFDDRARRSIRASIEGVSECRILEDDELEQLGVLFPDRRYGELIVLLDPGWLVEGSGFEGDDWRPRGMHGYHPEDPFSDGVFLSNRRPEVPVRSLADVYHCMRVAVSV